MAIGRAVLEGNARIAVQYWDIRDPKSLAAIDNVGPGGALLAVAAYLGTTRLIDNIVVS